MTTNDSGTNSMCELCGKVQWKYKCPRCNLKTCSLACVKQHKVQTNCSGIRDKTAFVKMRAMTDMHLLSDYRMLEDVDRSIDNHSRDPLRRSGANKVVNNMKKIAEKKGFKVKFLPYPMSKRKNNSTRLSSYRTGDFLWHVELIFPQSDIKYTERRYRSVIQALYKTISIVSSFSPEVHENTCLEDLLKMYIHPTESDPVKRQMLKSYCRTSIEDCHVFMQEEGLPANIKRYHRIDLKKSLIENLQGKEFIEYPTFHIVLPDNVDQYPMKTSND